MARFNRRCKLSYRCQSPLRGVFREECRTWILVAAVVILYLLYKRVC